MHQLKGAIFSLRDVLVVQGQIDPELLAETTKLLQFLLSKGVQPVIVSNSAWTIRGTMEPIQEYLSKLVGAELPYFQGGRDMPVKQKPAAMKHILAKHEWQIEEAVYVGSTEHDMQAARNGGLLFLNANWHAENSPYGFQFSSPKDIARFIDCCCLGLGDWFWKVEDGPLRVYAMAPLAEFSKRYPGAKEYSTDAKNAAKFNKGDVEFWGRLMAARIYFSGIGAEASYVAPYPGHSPSSKKPLLTNALKIVSGSLKAQYLDDLVVRHAKAEKSQLARRRGVALDHNNQLNTINLRKDPRRTGPLGKRYVRPPLRNGKTVVVVDDICTEGHSLEAARAFIENTGANVICLSWLKTPGPNHYKRVTGLSPTISSPYKPYVTGSVSMKTITNNSGICNENAPVEIADAFGRYGNWDWPDQEC